MWDYLCVLKAIRPHLAYFPAWKTNFEGSNRHLIRLSGGIPVPEDSARALIKFNEAIEEVLKSGKWLHFFPEGSLWFFYPDIRPLKKAVFKYAVRYEKPIIPITMSFRPRKGIMKLFGKSHLLLYNLGVFGKSALGFTEHIAHNVAKHRTVFKSALCRKSKILSTLLMSKARTVYLGIGIKIDRSSRTHFKYLGKALFISVLFF